MDMILTQRRFYDDGIVGLLKLPLLGGDYPTLFTLELPWVNNKQDVSCIPHGEYDLTPEEPTGKFKYPHLGIWDVEDRFGIRIHVGNYPKDTTGCILVGLGEVRDRAQVTRSRDAMGVLMELVGRFVAQTGRTTLTFTHIEAPEL